MCVAAKSKLSHAEEAFDGSLVEAFPDIDVPTQPVDMRMTPDGTKWWIVGMEGQIVEASSISLLVRICWSFRTG